MFQLSSSQTLHLKQRISRESCVTWNCVCNTLYQCLCKRSVSVIVGDGCERKPGQWLPDRAGQGKICKCSCCTSHWHRVHVWGKRHCFLLPVGGVGFCRCWCPPWARDGPRPLVESSTKGAWVLARPCSVGLPSTPSNAHDKTEFTDRFLELLGLTIQ